MNRIIPPQMRYDALTIRLHWLSAALVLGLWCIGRAIDWFPKGAPRVWVRSSHIALGVLLLATIAYRLYWRRTSGRHLPPPSNMSIAQARAATGLHHLLYVPRRISQVTVMPSRLLVRRTHSVLMHSHRLRLVDTMMAGAEIGHHAS